MMHLSSTNVSAFSRTYFYFQPAPSLEDKELDQWVISALRKIFASSLSLSELEYSLDFVPHLHTFVWISRENIAVGKDGQISSCCSRLAWTIEGKTEVKRDKGRINQTKLCGIKGHRSRDFLQLLPKADATHLSQDLYQLRRLGKNKKKNELVMTWLPQEKPPLGGILGH